MEQTFAQKVAALRDEVVLMTDDHDKDLIEATATRLEGLKFTPPVITPLARFMRLQRGELLSEIDRILVMPEEEACALAPDNPGKCEDLRVQYITVLIYYYKKLVALRSGDSAEWDEIDELYVHD